MSLGQSSPFKFAKASPAWRRIKNTSFKSRSSSLSVLLNGSANATSESCSTSSARSPKAADLSLRSKSTSSCEMDDTSARARAPRTQNAGFSPATLWRAVSIARDCCGVRVSASPYSITPTGSAAMTASARRGSRTSHAWRPRKLAGTSFCAWNSCNNRLRFAGVSARLANHAAPRNSPTRRCQYVKLSPPPANNRVLMTCATLPASNSSTSAIWRSPSARFADP